MLLLVFAAALFALVSALLFTLLLPAVVLYLAQYLGARMATVSEPVFIGLYVVIAFSLAVLITTAVFAGAAYPIRRFNERRLWRSGMKNLGQPRPSSSPSAQTARR